MENHIRVRVYKNYGTIVSRSYVYCLAIVQRLFDDRQNVTEWELSYDRYCIREHAMVSSHSLNLPGVTICCIRAGCLHEVERVEKLKKKTGSGAQPESKMG